MKSSFILAVLLGMVAGAVLIKNCKPAEQLVEKGQEVVKAKLQKKN